MPAKWSNPISRSRASRGEEGAASLLPAAQDLGKAGCEAELLQPGRCGSAPGADPALHYTSSTCFPGSRGSRGSRGHISFAPWQQEAAAGQRLPALPRLPQARPRSEPGGNGSGDGPGPPRQEPLTGPRTGVSRLRGAAGHGRQPAAHGCCRTRDVGHGMQQNMDVAEHRINQNTA